MLPLITALLLTLHLPALSSEQRRVLGTLIMYGKRTERPTLFTLAAVETALVEQELHNTDEPGNVQVGWRQELPWFGNTEQRLNLTLSVPAFYRECRELDRPGMNAGQLAAAVQRPLAEYAGRYQQAQYNAITLITEWTRNGVHHKYGGTRTSYRSNHTSGTRRRG